MMAEQNRGKCCFHLNTGSDEGKIISWNHLRVYDSAIHSLMNSRKLNRICNWKSWNGWNMYDSEYLALKMHTAFKRQLDGLKFSRTSPTSHICRNNLAFLQNLALSYNGLQNFALCCKIFHDIANPCNM